MSTRREQHRAHVDPPRVVVVDDEPLARRRLRDLLAGAPGVSLAAECRNGTSAVDAIASVRPDVVLLDIEMPGRDGMGVAELLRALGDDAPVFVFVTAHAEHAVRAFDVRAADYLLKPYSAERLYAALDRARELLRARRADRLPRRGPGDAGRGTRAAGRGTRPACRFIAAPARRRGARRR